MTIQQVTVDTAGQIGVNPRIVKVVCDNTLTEVTTQGFLNNNSLPQPLKPTDIVLVYYAVSGGFDIGFFQPVFTASGDITLYASSADVTLPTTNNYLAVFKNTAGGLKNGAVNAFNPGNLTLGLSAAPVYLYLQAPNYGRLMFTAANNPGDTNTVIVNAAMGQESFIVIPDPGVTDSAFVLNNNPFTTGHLIRAADGSSLTESTGYKLISNTTASWGGGSTTHQFAAVGLTSASKGSGTLRTSTNVVALKCVPGNDVLDVTFSADPGAGTSVDYIYTTAAAS